MRRRVSFRIVRAGLLLAVALIPMAGRAGGTGSPAAEAAAIHVLDRLGYGPRPGDLAEVEAMGVDRWIDRQLDPERIPLPPSLDQRLASLQTLHMNPIELFRTYGPAIGLDGVKPTPEEAKATRKRARIILQEAIEARFLRATESPRQLQEVMVDFWYNHFNVAAEKELDHLWVGAFEEEAIRPHALGRFRDLLEATATHPAMLFYLDNWRNTAPGSPGKDQGLNENYAREVMELHTLGVDGGYTQEDVVALARIFTGWGFPKRRGGMAGAAEASPAGFVFVAERHDFSDKVFLGRTIQGRGMAEGEEALDMLARSPATARHIGYQLAQYFVADDPDPALVKALAKRFLETDDDIREVLRTLFHSAPFRDPKNYGAKYKTPYQYVVSTVRATGKPVLNTRPLWAAAAQMGMPIYGYATPEGYKNTRAAWLSPDATAKRLGFATGVGTGHNPFDRVPPPDIDPDSPPQAVDIAPEKLVPVDDRALIDALGPRFLPATLDAIAGSEQRLRSAMVLGSPEFMNR